MKGKNTTSNIKRGKGKEKSVTVISYYRSRESKGNATKSLARKDLSNQENIKEGKKINVKKINRIKEKV